MPELQQHILIAEDHPVLARVIQFNLEQAGYAVTVAGNGSEAIEYLSSEAFDLLITDYQMPILDGAAVCDFVRQKLQNNTLPIILCSAKGMELDASELNARWQLTRVFYKPFSVKEMLRCVEALFAVNSTAEPASSVEYV